MIKLFVPTLGLDLGLIERLADSIDFPVHKIAVNNGRIGALDSFIQKHRDWEFIEYGRNLGVAASWNLAPASFPDDKFWLICNNDYCFNKGDLQKMCECAEQHCDVEPIIFASVHTKASWPCFIWTKSGVERFGTFDENFWPIYFEDCDMMIRHKLAGVKYRGVFPGDYPLIHGKPATGNKYNAMIELANQHNRSYWREKWGNDDYFGQPAWSTPFNKPVHTGYWKLDTEQRRTREQIFDEFLSQQNPSLYS